MRKIIFQNLISLDGYFEGSNNEIDWHNVDEEFNEFAIDFLITIDILLFGRKTYELMASYWPTETAITNDPLIAEKMNNLLKIVVSKSLSSVEWKNTRLVKDNAAQEVSKLKKQPGKDIAIFGSSDFCVSLIQHNLIDEYRILINPIVLGKGKPLFKGINDRLKLKFLKARAFKSGNVLLCYESANNKPAR